MQEMDNKNTDKLLKESELQPNQILMKRLYTFNFLMIPFTAFFWGWALLNNIKGNYDLGVVSFLLAFVSVMIGLVALCKKNLEVAKVYCWAIPISSLIVAINYLAGAFLYDKTIKKIYCWIFVVIWILISLVSGYLSCKFKKMLEGNSSLKTSQLK